jgi:hypothetical protein
MGEYFDHTLEGREIARHSRLAVIRQDVQATPRIIKESNISADVLCKR